MVRALRLHVLRADRLIGTRRLEPLPLTVGSDPSCGLVLPDEAVAGIAGEVQLGEGGRPRFAPRGKARTQPIAPGVHLAVGPYTLAFSEADEESGAASLLGRLPDLVRRLWAAQGPDDGLAALLETAREAFGARWGAIVELEAPGAPPILRCTAGRRDPAVRGVSRTVLERLEGGERAVLTLDVPASPELRDASSIAADVRAVLAARLASRGPGSIHVYLESAEAGRRFTAADRDLLLAVAGLAAELVERARAHGALAEDNVRLDRLARLGTGQAVADLVGSGPAMARIRAEAGQVAASQVTALLLGESGTGKEVLARAIHARSPRCDRPFVAVNCAALPADLIESELFGSVKGAFSGAETRPGRFELAQGGTLFLDEVGELPPAAQAKLLRVLEARTVERLGEGRARPVDVHLLAATNADLPTLAGQGRFRPDLFYRLSVFVIRLPPLRERLGDLPELAGHLLRDLARTYRKAVAGIEPEAMAILARHPWPGNVRELRNVLEQGVVRETGPKVSPASLFLLPPPARPQGPEDEGLDLESALAACERRLILAALEAEHGNATRTLKRLGISRSGLYRKLTQHGIDPGRLRG